MYANCIQHCTNIIQTLGKRYWNYVREMLTKTSVKWRAVVVLMYENWTGPTLSQTLVSALTHTVISPMVCSNCGDIFASILYWSIHACRGILHYNVTPKRVVTAHHTFFTYSHGVFLESRRYGNYCKCFSYFSM